MEKQEVDLSRISNVEQRKRLLELIERKEAIEKERDAAPNNAAYRKAENELEERQVALRKEIQSFHLTRSNILGPLSAACTEEDELFDARVKEVEAEMEALGVSARDEDDKICCAISGLLILDDDECLTDDNGEGHVLREAVFGPRVAETATSEDDNENEDEAAAA